MNHPEYVKSRERAAHRRDELAFRRLAEKNYWMQLVRNIRA
jgi:hypothetical protein